MKKITTIKKIPKRKIQMFSIALWMAGVQVDELTAEAILLTIAEMAKGTSKYTLMHGAKIQDYLHGKAQELKNQSTKMLSIPFSPEQVKVLNKKQQTGEYPYTCGGSTHKDGKKKCERLLHTGEGKLIATEKGLVCPCGLYKQTWAHDI